MQNSYLQSLESKNIGVGNTSTEDPYAPGVAEAYGLSNDKNGIAGFDSASDSVGPGIYGGSVQRDDSNGDVLIGTQYENHNHVPGPLYDGNGYSLMGRAIHVGPDKVKELLTKYPQLLEEISTGGARPLHICGMSERGQHCTQILIDAGADIHALDTYNYNALHRMASNDLEIGAEALVHAGLDPNLKDDRADSTPIDIAKRQRAIKFLMKMQKMGHYD
jgi:ankyrin repeat protein